MPKREHTEATRAFWSGTISFGLVSIPVDLYAAVRGRRTSMKLVDADGNPLGRQYYCPQDGKTLSSGELVRGYETDSGKMVVVTDEELEAVAPEMTRDIELRRFVPRAGIPSAYYHRAYFLAPSGASAKAYHLLAAVMESTNHAGIGTFVMRGHQYLVAILEDAGMLRAEILRFASELRSPKDVGLTKLTKAPAQKVKAFAKALGGMTRRELDIDELSDWYAGEIGKLAENKKNEGKDVVDVTEAESEDAEEGAEVIDLMNLLKQRLAATGKAPPVRGGKKARRHSR